VETGSRRIVGVNEAVGDGGSRIGILSIDEAAGARQAARLEAVRRRRDPAAVEGALARIREAASGGANTMPPFLEAVRAYATVGEMCDALRDVWGEFVEVPII
jgi:methylmalonyl-CoA mutase N-terminal domain/subunit